MAELINLRLARKGRRRAEAEARAAANRARFGETKSAGMQRRAEAERMTRQLDGARRNEDRRGQE
jgi:hypothetical protein